MELNADQENDVRNFLLSRGLALKPLLDEMTDHITCDLENLMDSGMSYDEAWTKIISDLPEDHFKIIQQETMETINNRFTLSRVFTFAAMAAMLMATIFKLLHLPGASELLLVSFAAMGSSLLSSSVSGIYFNRERKGAVRVMAIVTGILLMLAGYSFKMLHLPGASELIVFAAATLVVSMIVHAVYVYSNASGNGNLFTFLHEKYSPGIERFLLIIVTVAVTSCLVMKLAMLHIVIVYAAGLQLFALASRKIEQHPEHRNLINLVTIIVAVICLTIPMLGELAPFNIRLIAVTLFSVAAAILAVRMESKSKPSTYIVCFVATIFLGIWMAKSGTTPFLFTNLIVNLGIAGLIVLGIFLSPKHSISRTFLVLSLSGFILEVMIL